MSCNKIIINLHDPFNVIKHVKVIKFTNIIFIHCLKQIEHKNFVG